jgi:hypothetical protein
VEDWLGSSAMRVWVSSGVWILRWNVLQSVMAAFFFFFLFFLLAAFSIRTSNYREFSDALFPILMISHSHHLAMPACLDVPPLAPFCSSVYLADQHWGLRMLRAALLLDLVYPKRERIGEGNTCWEDGDIANTFEDKTNKEEKTFRYVY